MKNYSLVDFFSSDTEFIAIDHFLESIAKTNTFDQRLSTLQEQLQRAELFQKQSIHQMGKDKQQYQQEIRKLTQQHCEQLNKKIADLKTLEIRYRQEIDELKQKLKQPNDKINIVKPVSLPSKKQSINSATELDRGVWTDEKTGLMWARISIGQEWKDGKCIRNARRLNWEGAKKACQDFKLSNYDDWRLPTINELRTLMIKSKTGFNSPERVLFSIGHNEWGEYWSETLLGNNISAWSVDFNTGVSYTYNKEEHNYARLVRTAF
ncbi:DUF1566 domain-containing protein [Acinetobacter beijerinckii]|uniref:Lcl domain-containing protein n=2 Tax=Acinetobacter TaxID=469 RepID=UPI0024054A2A|nr:DUF1566 domain-containing protein [Acinetobacter beijerinckii]